MLPHLASYNLKLCFLFVFVCFVLRYSLTMYVVQGGLELEGHLSSSPSARITGVHCHAWLRFSL